jgi:hypothetical protein
MNTLSIKKADSQKIAQEQGFRNIQFFVDDGYSVPTLTDRLEAYDHDLVENDQIGVLIAKDIEPYRQKLSGSWLLTPEVLFPEHNVSLHRCEQRRGQ